MALTQIDLTMELREVSLKNRPQQLHDISPKETVPVLQLQNGEVIDESLDIMLWCFQQNEGQLEYSSQLEFIKIIDGKFKYWLDRYKYHERHPEYSRDYYRDKCTVILSQFENLLEKNIYFSGNEMQLADMAIFPFIRQFAHVDKDWFLSAFQALTEWYQRIHASPVFTGVMEKYDFWKEGDDPLLINFYEIGNTEQPTLQKL